MKIKLLTAIFLTIGLSLAGFLNFVTMDHGMADSACGAQAALASNCASPITTSDNCLIFHLGMLATLSQANVQSSPLLTLLLLATLALGSFWIKPANETTARLATIRSRRQRVFSDSIGNFYKKLDHWLALHEARSPRRFDFGAGSLAMITVGF